MATESLYYSPPVSSETGEPASSCPQGRDRVGPEAVVETPKARLHFRYPEQCLPCRAGVPCNPDGCHVPRAVLIGVEPHQKLNGERIERYSLLHQEFSPETSDLARRYERALKVQDDAHKLQASVCARVRAHCDVNKLSYGNGMAAVGIEGRHFDQLTQLVHSADEAADEALRLLQVSGGGVQGI